MLVIVAVTIVLGSLLFGGVVFAGQRSMLYPAPPPEAPRIAGAQLVQPTPEEAYLVVKPPPGAPLLVHFHGNGEQLAGMDAMVGLALREGLGLVAVEYPGYGLLDAKMPSERAFYETGERAIAYARKELGVEVGRTILVGQSLGSGTATELARRGHGARLVLLTPFTSVPELAQTLFPWLPARLLVRDRFDNAAKAPQIRVPVLVLHGTADEVVPFEMGRRLSAGFPSARLVTFADGGHNDLFARFRARIEAEIGAFARAER